MKKVSLRALCQIPWNFSVVCTLTALFNTKNALSKRSVRSSLISTTRLVLNLSTMRLACLFFVVCTQLLPVQALANATVLRDLFSSFGNTNVTMPGGFQDQAAGHYTAGGVYARNPSTSIQPFQVSLPRIGAGCNGLDLYLGSFSFLKGEQLTQMLRNIGTAVPTYAFQLGLKTLAPQLENLMAQIRKIAMDVNNMMLDSCQASQQIVGGLWPAGAAASEQICQDVSRQGGEDWFGARKHCETPKKQQENIDRLKRDVKNKDLLEGEYNLTALIAARLFPGDSDMCHFLLTAIGTVVSKRTGDNPTPLKTHFPGLGSDAIFIEAHVKGGAKTQQRICVGDDKCLIMKIQDLTIATNESLKEKMYNAIVVLIDKYKSGIGAMDKKEKTFLTDTVGLPIYRYIQVAAAIGSPFMLVDVAEHIAHQLLLSRFERAATEVLLALEKLGPAQVNGKTIEVFQKQIQTTKSEIMKHRGEKSAQALHFFNKAIQHEERIIEAKEYL